MKAGASPSASLRLWPLFLKLQGYPGSKYAPLTSTPTSVISTTIGHPFSVGKPPPLAMPCLSPKNSVLPYANVFAPASPLRLTAQSLSWRGHGQYGAYANSPIRNNNRLEMLRLQAIVTLRFLCALCA